MITGVHAIIFTKDAEGDRAFFRDVLDFPFVDAGGGWLIFALPPAELAAHPADEGGAHELYLMCDDIHATVAQLQAKRVDIARPVSEEGFGLMTAISAAWWWRVLLVRATTPDSDLSRSELTGEAFAERGRVDPQPQLESACP